MTPFTTIRSIAAALDEENVDTDIIFPARFLLITAREGLGDYAFHDRRADNPDFVLNNAPFDRARILIVGANFGAGSSREQAVWALAGFGIGCVIAPSFGEIFYANCLCNGVLPIVLPQPVVAAFAARARTERLFTVDLDARRIVVDGDITSFSVAADQRLALLSGWDETETILNTRGPDIALFENRQRAEQPWLWEAA